MYKDKYDPNFFIYIFRAQTDKFSYLEPEPTHVVESRKPGTAEKSGVSATLPLSRQKYTILPIWSPRLLQLDLPWDRRGAARRGRAHLPAGWLRVCGAGWADRPWSSPLSPGRGGTHHPSPCFAHTACSPQQPASSGLIPIRIQIRIIPTDHFVRSGFNLFSLLG